MMRMPSMPVLRSVLCGAITAVAMSSASAQVPVNAFLCGSLNPPGQFGPFDYRTVPSEIRHKVEDYHFTPLVESTKGGSTSATAGSDLDYTLRAFPNNPRALRAVAKYAERMKTDRPNGLRFPAECYFERAIRFMPDDAMPHLLYASYLKDRRRTADARSQLDEAERLRGEPTNFDLDYNLGLLYFDIGVYDKSLEAAKRAYDLGAPLPALQKKLKAAGKWKD